MKSTSKPRKHKRKNTTQIINPSFCPDRLREKGNYFIDDTERLFVANCLRRTIIGCDECRRLYVDLEVKAA